MASAESMAQGARDGAQHQADRVAGAVQQSPFAALGIAALVGFTVAALLRR
jgi:ElaB/YqjD/DUF883 family membrane-anchored ribosome-binding protein